MRVCVGVDELCGDAHCVPRFAYTALKDMAHAKLFCDQRRADILVSELE